MCTCNVRFSLHDVLETHVYIGGARQMFLGLHKARLQVDSTQSTQTALLYVRHMAAGSSRQSCLHLTGCASKQAHS